MLRVFLVLLQALTGSHGSKEPSQIGLELLWEAGSVEGSEGTGWMQLGDAVLTDGFVFALDRRLPAVRKFNLDGTFEGELGRSGQGPGEFGSLSSLRVTPEGVEVFEVSPSRRSAFRLGGELIETVSTILPEGHLALSWAKPLSSGWTVAETVGEMVEGLTDFQESVLAWRDPRRVDTLAQYSAWTLSGRVNNNPMPIPIPPIAGPAGDAETLGDSLVVLLDGDVGSLQILALSPEGVRTVRRWDLPGQAVGITEGEKEIMFEMAEERWPGVELSEVTYPEKRSGWVQIEVESEEAVWMKRGGEFVPPTSPTCEEWVRWDIESGESQELVLPERVTALGFAPGFLIAKRLGEWDVEYLQLYKLTIS